MSQLYTKLQKLYLSDNNFYVLVDSLEKILEIKYDIKIDNEIFDLCHKIRKYIIEDYVYDKTTNLKSNILKLNQSTILYIENIIRTSKQEQEKIEYQKKISGQYDVDELKMQREMLNLQQAPKDVTTEDILGEQIKVNADKNLTKNLEYLNKSRQLFDKQIMEQHKNDDEIQTLLSYKTEEEMNIGEIADMKTRDSSNDNVFLDKKHLLIQKPDDVQKEIDDYHKKRKIEKDYYILVDSRDRNYETHPEPNKYEIELDTTFKDVLEIELLSANIPKSEYNINNSNNTIHFQVGATEYSASLAVGTYTSLSTLLTDLKTAMDGSGSGLTYTLTSSTLTNKITISATGSFDLLFNGGTETYGLETRNIYKENSIGYNLGFKRLDLTGASSYDAQNIYNISGENYVLLNIKDLENLSSTDNSKSSIRNSFTKINLNTDLNTTKYHTITNDYETKLIFKTPRNKLADLEISFYNYNGSLYDFNGLEHSLYFKIKTLSVDWKRG